MGFDVDGVTYLVPVNDVTWRKFFVRRSRKEIVQLPRALERLERAQIPARRDVFLDGGANIGTTTLAAVVAGFRSVVAFEPVPSVVRILRAALALNGVTDAVNIHEVALSDRTGRARLKVHARSSGRSKVVPDDNRGEGTTEVPTVRLDDLVATGEIAPEAVGFVWLDVEDHEAEVLAGAETILAAAPPLVVEVRSAAAARRLFERVHKHYAHANDLRRRRAHEFRPLAAVFDDVAESGKSTNLLLANPDSGRDRSQSV